LKIQRKEQTRSAFHKVKKIQILNCDDSFLTIFVFNGGIFTGLQDVQNRRSGDLVILIDLSWRVPSFRRYLFCSRAQNILSIFPRIRFFLKLEEGRKSNARLQTVESSVSFHSVSAQSFLGIQKSNVMSDMPSLWCFWHGNSSSFWWTRPGIETPD
jgi:hypothetical protein